MSDEQKIPGDEFEDEFSEFIPEPHLQQANSQTREDRYLQLITVALRACAHYRPMFGKGRKGGLSLGQFQEMYGADPFYSWVGLDSPLMYAAHKAAGGMTSIYRQLGISGEWVFRNILRDSLGLSAEQAVWSYQVPTPKGKLQTLTLDGRVQFDHVQNPTTRARIQ